MKKHLIPITVLFTAALLLSGCASLLNSLLDKPEQNIARVSNDPLDGYVFAYREGSEGTYNAAKILKPASPSTKNQAEILDMNSNSKRWARVFTTHPAGKEELAVGEVVLVQSSGYEDPDKDTLLATLWDAYYVTDTSDLYKGMIKAGYIDVSTKHVRIPDTEITVR